MPRYNFQPFGVLIDSELTMAYHIAALGRAFFYMRQFRSIGHPLTSEAMFTLMLAFVISRLD